MSRPAVMNMSSFTATSSSAASSPIASESPGMPKGSGKPRQQDDYWIKLIRRSVDVSSAAQGCIPWRVDGRAAGRPVASRKRKFRRLRQSWGWDLVPQKRTCCPKQWGLGRNPCTRSQFFSWPRKSKEYGSGAGPPSPHIAENISLFWKPSSPWSGKSMEDNLAILWKIWMWIWLANQWMSWTPLFEQRFISAKTMTRIWDS